ncbi:Coenzyme F420 hydrogenase/dehydrogenase, beta subunit C-terminal domain [Galactobacillus timonensis]|uniref:Coenzyme F420 hydrogenase/dehydrogenase, beta subunit C-terminal domain n=1 Tax=Galactobacillus timonensis TaxID=2041840 RepID=UPI000C81AEE0|nr:Coenzyme F420 hydrogenase/dehydrogenase, beta subunit C-terminal domain [Galactobacillus timonensis]
MALKDNISIIGNACVGCRSCEQSCPVKCIMVMPNNEGFLYPNINEEKCIHCGNCMTHCPIKNQDLHRNTPKEVWALRNKNDKDIFNSASGGASDLLASDVLNDGGIVYGAAYDDNFRVYHIEITKPADKWKIQSSKYVQSDTENVYTRVKDNLKNGKQVLFTGTPCQIAGLYAFLGKDYENLYTIDLICHGVPSPLFFKKYLEWQDKKMGGKTIYYNFRSKAKRGWGTQYLLKTKTKTKTKTLSLDKYGCHFMAADCYRESCYQCLYANTKRVGDITIGDFWGIGRSHPAFYSEKGVSSVFINTDKGKELFGRIKKDAFLQSATLEEGLIKQGNLEHPAERPKVRDRFYADLNKLDFIEKIQVGLKVKERLKAILPADLIRILKNKAR